MRCENCKDTLCPFRLTAGECRNYPNCMESFQHLNSTDFDGIKLAASAQDFHGECWRTGCNQPLFDRYIDQVLKASKEYSRLRFGEGPELTEKQFNRVQLSVRIIAKKTCEWLYQDYLSQRK